MKYKEIKCPYCGSTRVKEEVAFYFILYTDRMYKCRECKRTFFVRVSRQGDIEILFK